jgi:hypothetical protein
VERRKFHPDLSGQVPPNICAVCAVTNTFGNEFGAIVFCEHSQVVFTRAAANTPWRRCRISDLVNLVRALDIPGPLRRVLALGEATDKILQ